MSKPEFSTETSCQLMILFRKNIILLQFYIIFVSMPYQSKVMLIGSVVLKLINTKSLKRENRS